MLHTLIRKFVAAMYQIYFVSEWHSTCFGRSFRPSSGVQLLASRQQYRFGCCMYSLELLMMDGKDRPKLIERHSKMK